MHYILFYDYVEDILERRGPYRDGHLALLQELAARGELVLGGAFTDSPAGAALVFKVDDPATIEVFVAKDPYAVNGLVTGWQIREWNVVVGSAA